MSTTTQTPTSTPSFPRLRRAGRTVADVLREMTEARAVGQGRRR